MSHQARKPQAFRLESATKTPKRNVTLLPLPEHEHLLPAPIIGAAPAPRRTKWGFVLLSSLGALLTLWATISLSQIVDTIFAKSMALGWVSVALALVAGFAALMMLLREIWAFARLSKVSHIQVASARAINQNDVSAAQEASDGLRQLYASRPDLAWGLAEWKASAGDIIDAPEQMRLAERLLLEPLDEEARRIVSRRARRVMLLATITPTAVLDVILVAAQNLFMIREVAELYGGRPTFLATLRLSRMVIAHLAVTAGLAVSENLLHLAVGKGVLGRLSARLGEGAINGILSIRLGLAACDICRPIAMPEARREKLTAMLKELLSAAN